MEVKIIADNREGAVLGHFVECSKKYMIDYEKKQMTVGDYAICINGMIKIIIERKTWQDLAASMTDGRKHNVSKLINLRNQTQCMIVYLIEGTPCPTLTKRFNRIPYKSLLAHLDHLQIRDGVHIIHTLDQEQTATRLFLLAVNYTTINEFKPIRQASIGHVLGNAEDKTDNKTNTKNNTEDNTEDNTNDETKENLVNELNDNKDTPTLQDEILEETPINKLTETPIETKTTLEAKNGNMDLLTSAQLKNYARDELLMKCIPSIGSMVATTLVEAGVTFYDLCVHKYQPEYYANIKFASGQKIGIDRGRKIEQSYKYITTTTKAAVKIQKRILQSINRVGKAADAILQSFSIHDIILNKVTQEQLAQLSVSSKRKVGDALAKNIINVLTGTALSEVEIKHVKGSKTTGELNINELNTDAPNTDVTKDKPKKGKQKKAKKSVIKPVHYTGHDAAADYGIPIEYIINNDIFIV